MDGDQVALLSDEILLPEDVATFRAEQAEVIRVLGKRMAADIVEIGQRLRAVHKTCGHGEWLPWLKREFEWSHDTAMNFMRVAETFGDEIPIGSEFQIDTGALYLLAGPKVPDTARLNAINEAEKGDHITKAKAAEMIADAKKETFEVAVATVLADREKERAQLLDANRSLAERLRDVQEKAGELPELIAAICNAIGQKKLSDDQYRSLAQILNISISANGKSYAPISKERQLEVEENLRIASAITRAFETLAGAPPPESFYNAAWAVQRKQHRRVCRTIIGWLDDYANLLDEGDTE